MDAAKEAIQKLTHNHGHDTTEVTEHYQPAVTHEHVSRTQENEATTVVDREQHHEHHHTTVLPVKDQEVLPTEHKHVLAPATHTEHHHGDHKHIHDKVAAEGAAFQDRREVGDVEHTSTTAPTIGSEHHHHHVHETIQPVVQKQTIQPSVVHTTIPVHEVHHNEPKHYTASALPAVSMDEFKAQGGSLTGIADRVERFEGEPENIAHRGTHTGTASTGLNEQSGLNTTGTTSHGLGNTTTGAASSGVTNDAGLGSRGADAGIGHSGTSGLESGATDNLPRSEKTLDSRVDSTAHDSVASTGSTGKPSLLAKLNPFKDADGDGKKGIMS